MNFLFPGLFHSVETKDARKQCMWIFPDMFIVILKNSQDKIVFRPMNGFDDKSIILTEVKETSAFTRASKLRKNVFASE